ncbi:KilA-N domain-containing protein [Pasteurella caecimuris]|uniref:P22AR C-terminal domain-containing protein n=1 Tax=Rodentibacter caecimuris TaxID=1796644 RepID=UPI002150638C|nr:P22AR C-terminal domain-containing protein [Pasteurella caecimuris]MCR1838507.1 KilA-N domain-containing protein [Pasteurella caecimuris]MCU0108127.1 KilA-N domain-containing protein [Pasteurella caecimuris]
MTNIITADYNGTQVFFQDDAYLNATAIAKHFNKLPNEWLRLDSTQEYIDLLCKNLNTEKSRILKTTRGVNGGTWLHRRLAVPFARWLNVEFAIWCDEQIEKILINKNQPKQLALPEPEKKFTFEFTEHELQQLSWAWFALLRCTEMCRVLEPALRQIGSHYAATVRDLGREYGYSIRKSHHTLSRITEQFQADQSTNWRVLRYLRNYDPKKIGFQLDIL